jgi:hypothetical protein
MTDFTECTTAKLLELIQQLNPEQIQANAYQMTPGQVYSVIAELSVEKDLDSSDKIFAVINGLTDRMQLEAAGKALLPLSALKVLEYYKNMEEPHHWKLSPIIVGMSSQVFNQILISVSPSQLQVLKQEGVTEPIQHHLAVLCNEITAYNNHLIDTINGFRDDMQALHADSLGFVDLGRFKLYIEQLIEGCQLALDKLDRALSIAWNTDRSDLIEKLSTVKEHCQKVLLFEIGHPRNDIESATGLYYVLEQQLNVVYGNAKDPKDIQALHDEDPAIDALIKFSVWYLQDYYELGLLPEITDKTQLELDSQYHTEQERVDFRRRLFQSARLSLNMIGLNTVGDLKRAGIFSKTTLAEYIKQHQETTT